MRDPDIETKIRLLHLMEQLGIQSVDLGLPGAGPRACADILALCREIAGAGLEIRPNCAVRTVKADITPLIEISQQAGMPIEACTFIGSSPIRQYAEEWSLDHMLRLTEEAVSYAVANGLPGDVRDRGHLPRHPGDDQAPVPDRDRRRRHAASASATPSATSRRAACAT